MKKLFLVILAALIPGSWTTTVCAQATSANTSKTDPFYLFPIPAAKGPANTDNKGRAERSLKIDPAMRTLVLITMGQSLMANANANTSTPVYVPANSPVVDNFKIYDGAA
jgi:hypothetical protein